MTTATPKPSAIPTSLGPRRLGGQASASDLSWTLDEFNIARKLGILFALFAIFLRISNFHELVSFKYHISYVLYAAAPPALLLGLFSGGLRRLLSQRPSYYWFAFAAWMVLALPFSSWKSGSLEMVSGYLKTELPFLMIFGGILLTWQDYKRAMYVMGLASAVIIWTSASYMDMSYGRVAIEFGTIANANDLAAHLIFILPFLIFLLVAPKIFFPMRVLAFLLIPLAIYYILGSASRGAFLALIVMGLAIFLFVGIKQKVLVLIVAPLLMIGAFAFLPTSSTERILSVFGGSASDAGEGSVEEARLSKEIRMRMLLKSLEYTVRRPIFGVGPGNFAVFEGAESRQSGQRGSWLQTHNVYTQISSECGIPGVIFYFGGMVSSFILARRTYRQARFRPDGGEIAAAALCLMMCMVSFGTCITFLTIGYRFYLLSLAGFSIVLFNIAQHQFATVAAPPQPSVAPVGRRPLL